MKSLQVWFEDEEHAAMAAEKGKQSWRSFICSRCGPQEPEARDGEK